MAERWAVSADGRTWTFDLRDGLRWRTAKPLDAPQVVASFRRAFAPKTAAPFAELFDALSNAQAVQAGKLAAEALGVAAPDARTRGVHPEPQRGPAGVADPADRVPGVPAGGGGIRHAAHASGTTGRQRRLSIARRGRRRPTSLWNATRASTMRPTSRSSACASRSPKTRRPSCSASPPAICTSPKRCRRNRWTYCAKRFGNAAADFALSGRFLARHESDASRLSGTIPPCARRCRWRWIATSSPVTSPVGRTTRLRHLVPARHPRLHRRADAWAEGHPGAAARRGAKALYRAAGYSAERAAGAGVALQHLHAAPTHGAWR